ncbi:Sec1-like protein [Gilbertella persicaria]|uniref:Sec1-like protein n=1 Tax=Gilbertella persicaria TaxID=101096 RepID=UPI00221E51AC|nr:Sec1-like protein [Gilbertella persicaria]KAI8066984.1 Sec1-like protein [Gilbertella persicaria]
MDTIRSIQPPGKWKIIVVDSKSIQIINAACKMYDILEENVTLVENIEKKRQPYPSLEAIYFLTPCRESILRLVDDFTTKPPTYKAAHVHFMSGLSDEVFADLNKRLKATGASQYVLSLKELYVDFMVNESSVFTVEPTTSFLSTFGDIDPEASLRVTAKQLLSVCATLGEDPIIRYQAPMEGIQASPAAKLAHIVQKEIDYFCRINPNFPPPRHPPQPRATLLIVDRSIDPVAPLLHEFTYQAMINDLLDVQPTDTGIKYTYEFNQADGSMGTKEVVLDEEDNVYRSIRHMHIAECSDHLIEKFNEFLAENKAATGDRDPTKDSAKSLKEMKDMLTNLPQFQDMKAKYSAHLSIAQECMSFFERHKLNSVGNLEQNMATGETADGETPKTIVLDMVPLLDDPHVSPVDKARLLMLYIIWKEGGIFEDDKRKLLEHAKLKGELRDAIHNLPLIGVKLTRIRKPERSSFLKKRRQRRSKDEETPYELSRYIPILKKVMEAHVNNTLDPKQFAFTRQSDMDSSEDSPGQGGIPTSGVSLRTTKPTWAKRTNSTSGMPRTTTGAKLIVFVIGGATYSEIRSAYEIGQTYNRDIILGTTEILRPTTFVEHLGQLKQPLPLSPSVIPPYVAPPPPPPLSQPKPSHESIHKATSLMSQLHVSTPSPHLSNKSSSLSLSTVSDQSTHTEEKEKKKKKGLKRFFNESIN